MSIMGICKAPPPAPCEERRQRLSLGSTLKEETSEEGIRESMPSLQNETEVFA